MKNRSIIIFTDLDGTVLTHKYGLGETQPTIKHLLTLGVKIVLCSSKTRSEIEYYRNKLNLEDPFISENGAAIFIPKNYFSQIYRHDRETERYNIIELGSPYSSVRKKFEKIREAEGLDAKGFGDMSAEELAEDSDLALDMARLAKQREYTEPFRSKGKLPETLCRAAKKEGLVCIKGGRYYHLAKNHDKAKAVSVLKNIYSNEFGELKTIGVGDDENDIGMLQLVDEPIMVAKKDLRSTWKNVLKIVLCCSFNGEQKTL